MSHEGNLRTQLLCWLLAPSLAAAYGYGGDYTPPAPICKPFKCPSGQKAAGNADYKHWSYGCKDSGINFMSMSDLNGLGGGNKGKNVDKCCVERDICKQTCGMSSKDCHDNFQACSKKLCKGDQNCNMMASMSDIRNDHPDVEEEERVERDKTPPANFDYEKDRAKRACRGYEHSQKAGCICVPEEDWQLTTDAKLKAFYREHNPEKLDSSGDIKDIDEVWKKWRGKEPQMFVALASKYKEKAVDIKVKPTPPPYKPPPPLSKDEQEKEDKRMAEQREKWAKEDAQRDEDRKHKDRERAERDRQRREEREEEEKRKQEEEDGEVVEL